MKKTCDSIDIALGSAKRRFVDRLPKSAAMQQSSAQVMPGGNTRTVLHYDPFPIVMTGGRDAMLFDADGNGYIDFIGEYSAGIFGHSNPAIRNAIIGALDKGLNLTAHNDLEPKLARLIVDRFPSIDLVRFTNSGTEANMLALSLACFATGRSTILVFKGAYHGGVLTFVGEGSPLNAPYKFILGNYNDTAGTAALIDAHRDDLAAVLIEPMLGAGGCIPGDSTFLYSIEAGCRDVGALFILDEVMTSRLSGSGRQGELGLRPDITTLGKYIGGGSSFGAFGGRGDLMAAFDPRRHDALGHAGTFNNNVISMAAGIAGLTQLYTPEVAIHLTRKGEELRSSLNVLCKEYDAPLQFSGLGSLMNAHGSRLALSSYDDLRNSDRRIIDLLFFHLIEDGIYIAPRGFIALNLALNDGDMKRLVKSVASFLVLHRSTMADAAVIKA
jgi:glutamate-1-semialdehyde 2,1-aminomutase